MKAILLGTDRLWAALRAKGSEGGAGPRPPG